MGISATTRTNFRGIQPENLWVCWFYSRQLVLIVFQGESRNSIYIFTSHFINVRDSDRIEILYTRNENSDDVIRAIFTVQDAKRSNRANR